MIKQAFIYAAGRATRLGPKYAHLPKILTVFGGRSLLEWHVLRLRDVGVQDISVITGHLRDQISPLLAGLAKRHRVALAEIHNPDFTEGSVLSFHVSLPAILQSKAPVLLMDGDVLYPGEMLPRLVGSAHASALLIDRNYSTDNDDPVLVPLRGGRPFDFVKKWKGTAEAVGESIGFFKLSPGDHDALATGIRSRLNGQGRLDSYDDVLRELVKADRFGCEDVTGTVWTEIDFPSDIQYAEQTVLPLILRDVVAPSSH